MNNNKLFHASTLIISVFMLASNPVQANIFKCVNKQGSVYYNDKPCPEKDKETQLKAIKDPKNGYIPKPIMEKKEVVQATKGIVVGKDSTKETDSKDKAKERKAENLVGDDASNKTLNTTNKDSVQSSASPPASFTMGSNTRVPTAQEESKGLLGSFNFQDKDSKKLRQLSKMIH